MTRQHHNLHHKAGSGQADGTEVSSLNGGVSSPLATIPASAREVSEPLSSVVSGVLAPASVPDVGLEVVCPPSCVVGSIIFPASSVVSPLSPPSFCEVV